MRGMKLHHWLGFILLVLSLILLIWGLWPEDLSVRVVPISPTEMQLPFRHFFENSFSLWI